MSAAQLIAHLFSATLAIYALAADAAYYLQVQQVMSLAALAGFFHLGISDGIFQKILAQKNDLIGDLRAREIAIAGMTLVGALVAFPSLASDKRVIIPAVFCALIVNQISLLNAYNNGTKRSHVHAMSTGIEKGLGIFALLGMIWTNSKMNLLWIPATSLAGYIVTKRNTEKQKTNQRSAINTDITTGLPLMIANFCLTSTFAIVVLVASKTAAPESISKTILAVSLVNAVQSYLFQYSLHIAIEDFQQTQKLRDRIITLVAIAIVVFAALTLMLRWAGIPSLHEAKEISESILLLSPIVMIEAFCQINIVPRLRRNNAVSEIFVANVLGFASCLIYYLMFYPIQQLGWRHNILMIYSVPAVVRGTIYASTQILGLRRGS